MSHCLNKSVELELRAIPGNNVCADCDERAPQWASVSLGIFMCLECSGRHRALGVHSSFVRSVSMDSWSEKQISMMRSGGNDKCNDFLAQYGVTKTIAIVSKYNSPAALLYKDRLLASVEGRPLPTELPKVSLNAHSGSDPLPGESESDYVARQRRLQDEAKQRMREKFGGSSGLKSGGGVMQGIGSDASYRPGGGGGSTVEIVPQLAEVSQKALTFVQSSIALLGEKVSKISVASTESTVGAQHSSSSSGSQHAQSQSNNTNQHANVGWAQFASGAVDLWKKASEATTELVKDLSKAPSDDDFKFPRPTNGNNPPPQQSQPLKGDQQQTTAWPLYSDGARQPVLSQSSQSYDVSSLTGVPRSSSSSNESFEKNRSLDSSNNKPSTQMSSSTFPSSLSSQKSYPATTGVGASVLSEDTWGDDDDFDLDDDGDVITGGLGGRDSVKVSKSSNGVQQQRGALPTSPNPNSTLLTTISSSAVTYPPKPPTFHEGLNTESSSGGLVLAGKLRPGASVQSLGGPDPGRGSSTHSLASSGSSSGSLYLSNPSSSKKPTTASVGDDFFANFGV